MWPLFYAYLKAEKSSSLDFFMFMCLAVQTSIAHVTPRGKGVRRSLWPDFYLHKIQRKGGIINVISLLRLCLSTLRFDCANLSLQILSVPFSFTICVAFG